MSSSHNRFLKISKDFKLECLLAESLRSLKKEFDEQRIPKKERGVYLIISDYPEQYEMGLVKSLGFDIIWKECE